MLGKVITTIKMGLSIFFLILVSNSAYSQVDKETWLKQFRQMAPSAMCHSLIDGKVTGQVLKSKQIDYKHCTSLITTSMDRCLAQYSKSLPSEINVESGKEWGKEVGKCSGRDFYTQYIAR